VNIISANLTRNAGGLTLKSAVKAYFPNTGLPLLHGRILSEEDMNAQATSWVNETFSRPIFSGETHVAMQGKLQVLDRPLPGRAA